MSIYDILGIKQSCSLEELKNAKKRFDLKKERLNIPKEWIAIVEKHYNLILKIGIEKYNERLNQKNNMIKDGRNVDILDDDFFRELNQVYDENVLINITNNHNRDETMKNYENSLNDTPKSNRTFRLIKTNRKQKTKGLNSKALALILAGSLAFSLGANSNLIVDKVSDFFNIGQEQTYVDEDVSTKKILIDYKVEANDTKIRIVNKFNLSDEEAHKIPDNIYIGEVYKIYVDEKLAEEYNYKFKEEKHFLCTYELDFGGTIYEMAKYVKETYPLVFENMDIGAIKEQIARDNNCSLNEYYAGTYVINCYITQKDYDELEALGVTDSYFGMTQRI